MGSSLQVRNLFRNAADEPQQRGHHDLLTVQKQGMMIDLQAKLKEYFGFDVASS